MRALSRVVAYEAGNYTRGTCLLYYSLILVQVHYGYVRKKGKWFS